jgi:dTDP-glucose pyrophosphorylase
MNIIMPMAGAGKRFVETGYTVPKPFIDVNGASMYRKSLGALYSPGDRLIVVTQEDHQPYFEAEPAYSVQPNKVFLTQKTEGAACSVLAARAFIDNDDPLIILNCDQLVRFDRFNWACLANNSEVDAIVFIFQATGNKWSYARLNEKLQIEQIAEKVEISQWATCGIYWWRHGYQFVEAADKMIAREARVNGEYYVAPTLNELISAGGLVLPFMVDEMISLGTPEALKDYLAVRQLHDVI